MTSETDINSKELSASRVGADKIQRIRALVLLSGTVRASRMIESIGRSLLDMPIENNLSIIDRWRQQADMLADMMQRPQLDVRVMVDQQSTMPRTREADPRVNMLIERDPFDYRGTGGVLLDSTRDYSPDDWLLVANGAQLLTDDLCELCEQLAGLPGDLALVLHRDGTPGGLMLLRCGVLQDIAPNGFVDMKEQALPEISKNHDVRVLHREQPTGLPVRTLADYVYALRVYHQRQSGDPVVNDPLAERLDSIFSLVEDGADVHDSAIIHDAIVLEGARVNADAVLVRSLVCTGAAVRQAQHVVDRLIAPPGRQRRQDENES